MKRRKETKAGSIAAIAVLCVAACTDQHRIFNPDTRARATYYIEEGISHDKSRLAGSGVYVCGVEVPAGYDWRKDTAIGLSQDSRIVVLKDLKRVLEFKTGYDEGVSTDPDTHHLIDGHLYTEFSTISQTIIKKDGKEIFRYSGRERLVGLCPYGNDIYTLSTGRDGEMMFFRRNGKLLIKKNFCEIYGSFSDTSYPETGALYEDQGIVYFAYRTPVAGYWQYHIVANEEDIIAPDIEGINVSDVKVINGTTRAILELSGYGFHYSEDGFDLYGRDSEWKNIRLYKLDDENFAVAGVVTYLEDGNKYIGVHYNKLTYHKFPYTEGSLIYLNGSDFVSFDPKQLDGYFFTPRCVTWFEGERYLACTPSDTAATPYVEVESEHYELALNGYITGINVFKGQTK